MSGAVLLAAGGALSATAGTMASWGCLAPANHGQCTAPFVRVTAIAAGSSHSLAVNSDGTVVAWGCSGADYGQCSVPAGLAAVTAIAAGDTHSLALKSDGTVVAWGCGAPNNFGQCSVPGGLTGVKAIAAGTSQSLALKSDGSVVAWGCSGDDYGQCSVPVGLAGVTAIAAGDVHSLALKSDGTVVAWGCGAPNNFGQCSVPGGLTGATAVSAGTSHSLALKSDGTVISWGCSGDDHGQCSVPGSLNGITAIAAGDVHSLALKSDGTVVAWGCGAPYSFGQCSVPGSLTEVGTIAAGAAHSLVRRKASQTIVGFRQPPDKSFGDPDFTLTASATSGLPVSFSASGNCTVSGSTAHITGLGSCTITASQEGDATDWSATQRSWTFAISTTTQVITLGALADKTYGDPDFAVSGSASSGLPVSLTAGGNCTVSGATVHITGAGSCTITANQPGDANFKAAPVVHQTFLIARISQTITFDALSKKIYGQHDFAVSASASSSLTVSFAARGDCTVSARTVHLTKAGSCTITASQPGDATYNAAPDVVQTFAIARPSCTPPKVVGKTLAAAKRMIVRKHCRTGKITRAYSSTRRAGTVVSQSRRPGRTLPNNSKIGLVVSRGRR